MTGPTSFLPAGAASLGCDADDARLVQRLDQWMAEFVRRLVHPRPLAEAVEYALLSGGKRVRPLLALRSCAAVCDEPERALPAAAGVELVHAFSLVHDDLPAIDNDDLRRGRPTLHIHAGEAVAILAGDAMLTLAFRALLEPAPGAAPGPALGARLCLELSEATQAMIRGQYHDTLGAAGAPEDPLARLREIHASKTGALLRASCRMGAISAGLADGDARLAAISAFSEHLGLMFQVADDLIDVEQTPEAAGKRTRKDADAGKLTYPGLLGIDLSRAEVARLEQEALAAIVPLGEAGRHLGEIARRLARRTS